MTRCTRPPRKAEGKVIFGGAIKESVAKDLATAFGKKYPGVQINYTRRSTEPMVQMIEADKLAGKVSFDLLNVTEPADLLRWIKEGFLAKVPMPDVTAKMLPETFDKDGHYYSLGITPMYGVYNTKKLNAGTAPKSLKELVADPKWVGAIAISRPIRGGTSSAALLNVANAVGAAEILKKAPDLKILLTRGNEAALAGGVVRRAAGELGRVGLSRARGQGRRRAGRADLLDRGRAAGPLLRRDPGQGAQPQCCQAVAGVADVAGGPGHHRQGRPVLLRPPDVTATPPGQPPLDKIKTSNFTFEKVVTEANALAKDFDKAVGLK